MSPLAWRVLSILIEQVTRVYKGEFGRGYMAAWTLGEYLGGDAATIDSIALKYTPRNEYEAALRELIDLGIVEEMNELPCRYRLVVREGQVKAAW